MNELAQLDFENYLQKREAINLLAQNLGTIAEEVSNAKKEKRKPFSTMEMIEKSLKLLTGHNEENPAYIRFFIPKSSGGKREIRAPVEPIKSLARTIYRELLSRYPLNRFIHGFRPNRSIVTNAKVHLFANHMVNWDVKDCFPSTSVDRVREVYGWTVGKNLVHEGVSRPIIDDVIDILCRLSTLRYGRSTTDVLPMGSPTSPALLNLILQPFDLRLAKHLRDIGQKNRIILNYSRYGDDLSISSPNCIPSAIFGIVPSLLGKFGYKINRNKTKIMNRGTSGSPLEVTGIIIGENRLLLSDKWLKKAEMFFIKIQQKTEITKGDVKTLRGIFGIATMIYDGELPPRLQKEAETVKRIMNKYRNDKKIENSELSEQSEQITDEEMEWREFDRFNPNQFYYENVPK